MEGAIAAGPGAGPARGGPVGRPDQLADRRAARRRQVGPVRLYPQGGTILRSFLPLIEGGSDFPRAFELRRLEGFTIPEDPARVPMQRQQLALLQVVSWPDFPVVFRDPRQFRWDYGLGAALRQRFAAPFQQPLVEIGSTRDLVLRGRSVKAAPDLVKEQEYWTQTRQCAIGATNLMPGVGEWVQQALDAYADLRGPKGQAIIRPRRRMWRSCGSGNPTNPSPCCCTEALPGAGPETTYQLGLCKHETAARLQARKDLAVRGGVANADDARATDDAWRDAEGYWKEFIENYSDRPGAASVRRLRGEVQALRGQTKEAIETWKNVSAPMTPLEKLASLWLAKQLAERKPEG